MGTMMIPTTNDMEQICSTNLYFVLISTTNDKVSRQRQLSIDDTIRYNETVTDYDLEDDDDNNNTIIWWPCYKCITLSQIDTIVQCKSLYSSIVNTNRIRAKALLDFFDSIYSSSTTFSMLDVSNTCASSIPSMYILLGDTTPNNQRLVFETNNDTTTNSKKRNISSITSRIGTVVPMNNETLGRLLIKYTVKIRQDISMKLAWCALKNIMKISFQNDTILKTKIVPPTSSKTHNTDDDRIQTDTTMSPQYDTTNTAQTLDDNDNNNDSKEHDMNIATGMFGNKNNIIDVQASSKRSEQKTITIQSSPPNTTPIATNNEESVAVTINDPPIHSNCEGYNAVTTSVSVASVNENNDNKESDASTFCISENTEVQSNAVSEQHTISTPGIPLNTTTIVTNSEESVTVTINDPQIHSSCERNNDVTSTGSVSVATVNEINDNKESDINTSCTLENTGVQSNAVSEQNTITTLRSSSSTRIATTSEESVAVDIKDLQVYSNGNIVTDTAIVSTACIDGAGIDSNNQFCNTANENTIATTISTADVTEVQHPLSNVILDQSLAVNSTDSQDGGFTSSYVDHKHQQTDCTSIDTAVDTKCDKYTKQKHTDMILQDILAVHKELMYKTPSLDEIEAKDLTDDTQLNRCLHRLGEVTRPTFAIDTTNSSYSQKILSVTLFLYDTFIRERTEKCTNYNKNNNTNQSNALFVCGMPGIGKTLGVQMTCLAIQRYWKSHHPKESEPILYNVNAASLANQRNPYDTILQNIYTVLGLRTEAQRTEKYLGKVLHKQQQKFILIIDEIDALVTGNGKTKDALRKLLDIANNNNDTAQDHNQQQQQQFSSKMAIIGISNCVNNIDHQKVLSVGTFNEPIFFHPYSESEIELILQARIGNDISLFDKPVLKRIANHVAKKSGDIRLALELVAEAIKLCLHDSKNNDCKPSNNSSKIIVSMKHACKAIDSLEIINVDHIKSTIRSRTPVENTTLAILLMIGKEHSKTINFVILQNYIREVIRKSLTDNLANSYNLQSVVTALVDSGLLVASINKNSKRKSGGGDATSSGGDNNKSKSMTKDTIELDLQIQEVIECFCKEHEHSSHYQKILEDATNDRDTF